ncbi:hypothetical protein ASF40_17600 [Microbacterium sp. Leaf288]|uniref:hypothetical protein n=1 Tax=Microbacterium sp. Leaf288 TaxID=1736323 RepID=UPI0006FDF5BB|nr:hypothetical protein [Microbacterium sp. Leaf288]KQP68479.1 hypothetical protein ASF40_17600 [Microbacterium sp. Leaf288]
MSDSEFETALQAAVADEVRRALEATLGPHERHRHLMDRARLFVAAYVWPRSAHAGDPELIAAARESVRALRALQGPGGLFVGGDNVDSPPDSSFTVNDLCDALELIVRAPADERAALADLEDELTAIADAIEPALLVGGVHTPNHRWEISAALARLHRRRPSPALRDRAEQWLAEGIDITPDGVYSERSANYAAYVSNPSLTVIADVFDRAEAREAVIRNLESTLGLIHPDDSVETVHSRRQDQLNRFPLAPYLVAYRRAAIDLDRGDFAWAAGRALEGGIPHPSAVLTELLLAPRIGEELPDAAPPAPQRAWEQSGLVVDATAHRRLVVFGGSDYARFRRVRSGLSANPTFLRMFAGDVVLDSVRLSRDFFGLGPFRADRFTPRSGERAPGYRLAETVSAHYYQPLDADRRSPSGEYALTDDGRFYGSMSFGDRATDDVSLHTVIDVEPTVDGAVVSIAIDGPDSPWALELAFRDGGVFEGVTEREDGTAVLDSGAGRYRVGSTAIAFDAGDDYRADGAGRYHPGEDYAFLGASDAAAGRRVYLTGRAPGRLVLTLHAEGTGE